MWKLGLTCLLIPLMAGPALSDDRPQPVHTVLAIFPNERTVSSNQQIGDGLRETLVSEGALQLNYLSEFLDAPRFEDDAYDKLVSDFLRTKYAHQPIDVIVAAGPEAFRFLHRHQEDLFVGVPALAYGIRRGTYEQQRLPEHFVCIPLVVDPLPTFELALRLQPTAREIVVITGASTFGRAWEDRLRRALTEWQAHPPVRYLSALPLEEVLSELSDLPPDTIVYGAGLELDGAGRTYIVPDLLQHMSAISSAPIYYSYSVPLGRGIVGGYMFQMADLGRQAGGVVRRILYGEKLTQKDMPEPLPSQYVVDWNQLQRWHLAEAKLPPGTVVLNRELTPWQKYKQYILAALLILTLQLFLIVVLLFERRQRRRSQSQLAERLRFETLLAEVASSLSIASPREVDHPILQCLHKVRDFFDVDLASIWQFQPESDALIRTHVWPEDAAIRIAITPDRLPDAVKRLAHGEIVRFADEAERESLKDAVAFRDAGIKSFLAMPLQSDERAPRVLSLIGVSKATFWPSDILIRLRTVADILGHVLARQRATKALRESELLKGSILESLRSNVCVIDNAGFIVEVNQAWIEFAVDNSMFGQSAVGVGVNYLEICRKSTNSEAPTEALAGISSVLSGARQVFEMEYDCHSPAQQRWFRMTVMRLPRAEGGAVISHMDITAQKVAEFNQHRLKEDAAQMNRATEMGQLVASLAHELAQPLAAVLSNAQAAARLLSRPHPDLEEIKTALADIIEDDQRANTVLNHVRSILKKHTIVPHQVNLNEIVEDVIAIVGNNAFLRGVQLKSSLSPHAVLVQGDEIPLQQLLLNLVINAMDAMSQLPADRRLLTVKTAIEARNSSGLMVVEDEGPGIPEGLKSQLFTPFFTTKNEGLGMGLPICAAILESLGGSIAFQNRSDRGAKFQVELPLAS